ncbi:MAG: hypothetical protein GXO63_00110 [Candidatus Micrarchaeota archaeon]|nr:hypothetical protein [Candidatus Micrarchaeota archaeon]
MRIAAVLVLAILVSGCVGNELGSKQMMFAGEIRNFRADLTKAREVPVYPNESAIREMFLDPKVKVIKISFIPGEYNAFYAVTGFELSNKLTVFYRYHFQQGEFYIVDDLKRNLTPCLFFAGTEKLICIVTVPVNSTDEINNSDEEITIFMKTPPHADGTYVKLENRTVVLSGKDMSEVDRDYTDLDLAADRFLLALLRE